MKASELKAFLDNIINEFGDLEVVVFPGDGEFLKKITYVTRAGIDKPIKEQQVFIETCKI